VARSAYAAIATRAREDLVNYARRQQYRRLIAAAETEAAARGCSQTVHFTYDFQARALYERNGYELVGSVENFPSGTDVLWYRKLLSP
jgi:GNAT superfamily N-acetyltransferase